MFITSGLFSVVSMHHRSESEKTKKKNSMSCRWQTGVSPSGTKAFLLTGVKDTPLVCSSAMMEF